MDDKSPEARNALAEFGVRVTHYRRQRGLTQTELGTLIGLGRTSIANMETGRQNPTILTVLDMAAVLDVLPAALLGGHPGGPRPAWVDQVRHEERRKVVAAMKGFLAGYEGGA